MGSAALLGGALAFQYIGGLAPCAMCLWQRWPHWAALALAGGALAIRGPVLPLLGGLSMLGNAGLGFFHAGVEQKWWQGPQSCTASGGGLGDLSGASLLSVEEAAPLVLCDEIAWQFLGLSMAGWNALFSLLLGCIWLMAARRNHLRASAI